MKPGTLYGIGIGPGDPELITLKGARLIGACRNLFVPKARTAAESVALAIARPLVGPEARIEELLFPMTADKEELAAKWDAAAGRVAAVLAAGHDACFLTLGDPLLYSTYIYLLRALRRQLPDLKAVTVPGIMAFGAAASLAEFPVGEGRGAVTIVPAADDLAAVRQALAQGGTVVLMKIGKRLAEVIDLLEAEGLLEASVFVSHATMADERIETDLRRLKAEGPEAGYLSIILVHAGRSERDMTPRTLPPTSPRQAAIMTFDDCIEFIEKAADGFLATVDGDSPHVRPMTAWRADRSGIYFYTSTIKPLAAQLHANPKGEIAFHQRGTPTDIGTVLRIVGKSEVVTEINIRKKLYEKYGWLKQIGTGKPDSPTIMVFRIASGRFNGWQWENNIDPGPWVEFP